MSTTTRAVLLVVGAALTFLTFPTAIVAQGETTSAIDGQVTDATAAAVFGARIVVTNRDTGLQRELGR